MITAISIRQPWAASLLYGIKDIENRTWPLPLKYANTPLLLHVGKAKPSGEWSGPLFERAMQCGPLLYGGIIGEIVFGPSVRNHPSVWADFECWHWPVVYVRRLAFYPCRGQLGIFKPAL